MDRAEHDLARMVAATMVPNSGRLEVKFRVPSIGSMMKASSAVPT
ncbi:hypothetical protein ACVIHI_001351 [Bradyrhizobium sp. USDA 4524]|nr:MULTISPECIES: hypothetical protein [unclassified Bradyrhizobium]MCP1837275.1 hypothetical protein [Bradyrhizobium sp. USDA 4538]MCP1906293.1 hypothetical protein [Bradyrhizobium sp. USDA 4537]MCP1988052.1 hypothetical protein [Bradyrhizobium sp. USDA 4539]